MYIYSGWQTPGLIKYLNILTFEMQAIKQFQMQNIHKARTQYHCEKNKNKEEVL